MELNKVRKIISTTVLTMLLVLVLSSCGGNRAIVGTWEIVETNQTLSRVGDRTILNADGTGRSRGSGFRWHVDGDYLVTNVPLFGNMYERFELEGNRLTVHHDDRGRRISVFERVE
ncbi:MAG: hypothetical protein FWD97_00545 [Defluviitaleaceae bacterium]|nr:hypothetical protein [Defluviitaleaceae bacterium]